MNKPNPVAEPSMEEILASIRRIISDGEEVGPDEERGGGAEASTDEVADPDRDQGEDEGILNLTEEMFAAPVADRGEEVDEPDEPEPPLPDREAPDQGMSMPMIDPARQEVVFNDRPSRSGQQDRPLAGERADTGAEAPSEAEATPRGHFRADSESASVESEMAHGHRQRPEQLMSPTTDATVAAAFGKLANTMLTQDSRTIEDLVKEMLRPMLKEWLDDNLPPLVERLVRAEIERVSRG